MAVTRTNAVKNLYSEQHRGNFSFDEELQINVVGLVEADPNGTLNRKMTKNLKFVWDTTSTPGVTFLGYAAPGSSKAAAVWHILKFDDATEEKYTPDGDFEFDNIWNNHTSLSYS